MRFQKNTGEEPNLPGNTDDKRNLSFKKNGKDQIPSNEEQVGSQ